MKVLFLLNGLTHYVVPMLNKLDEVDGIDVLHPTNGSDRLGGNGRQSPVGEQTTRR